jgi:hypothetical protein
VQLQPLRSTVHEGRLVVTRILGTGAATPTTEFGPNVTITRVSAGLYRYTFTEGMGTFIGAMPTIGAATPADVKGYTFVRDTYDTTANAIDIAVFNSSGTATDLAALQYMDVWFFFAATGSP